MFPKRRRFECFDVKSRSFWYFWQLSVVRPTPCLCKCVFCQQRFGSQRSSAVLTNNWSSKIRAFDLFLYAPRIFFIYHSQSGAPSVVDWVSHSPLHCSSLSPSFCLTLLRAVSLPLSLSDSFSFVHWITFTFTLSVTVNVTPSLSLLLSHH